MMNFFVKATMQLFLIAGLAVVMTPIAGAHANNLEGLVLTDAKYALEKENVTPVLKWVKGKEKELTQLFKATVEKRKKLFNNKKAIDFAFYQTLMKIHRECYQYKGCIPFVSIDPENRVGVVTRMADDVITTGAIDTMADYLITEVNQGIRARYAIVAEKAKHKDDNLADGQDFVDAYLELSHYAEHLDGEAPLGAPRK